MLHDVAPLEVHALLDVLHLRVHFVELIHEHVGLPLLVRLLLPLDLDSLLEPLLLLLEILPLDLLLEEDDLLLSFEALDEHFLLSELPGVVCLGEPGVLLHDLDHLQVA